MGDFTTTIQTIAGAASTHDVESAIKTFARDRGLPYLTFLRYVGAARGAPIWLTLPGPFIDAYRSKAWRTIDPSLLSARQGKSIIIWDKFDVDRLPKGQRELVDLKRSCGIHSGVTFVFHSDDTDFDCISVARGEPGGIGQETLMELHSVATQSWLRYMQLQSILSVRAVTRQHAPNSRETSHSAEKRHVHLLLMIDLANRHGSFGVDDTMNRVYTHRWEPEMIHLIAQGWVSELADDAMERYSLKLTPLGYAIIDQSPEAPEMRRAILREALQVSG